MDTTHQDILLRLRMDIIEDIDVDNDIIQPLVSEYVLKDEDVKYIYIGATKQDRAQRLLDLLPQYVYFIYIHILLVEIFFYCYAITMVTIFIHHTLHTFIYHTLYHTFINCILI
jgi:hypothetical protein